MKRYLLGIAIAVCSSDFASAGTLTMLPDLTNGKPNNAIKLLPSSPGVLGVAGNEIYEWKPSTGRVVVGSLAPYVGDNESVPLKISDDGRSLFGSKGNCALMPSSAPNCDM